MYADVCEHLFNDGDLCRTLDAHLSKIEGEVNKIPKNQFLFSSNQDIIDHLYSEMVINPIELKLDDMEMETAEIQINVKSRQQRYYDSDSRDIAIPGLQVKVTIPFTGDQGLWMLRPSSWQTNYPVGYIRSINIYGKGFLDIIFEERPETSPEIIKAELERNLEIIKNYLANQMQDINPRNEQLPDLIRQAITKRRIRLEQEEGLINHLKIPLSTKDGVPLLKPIQVEKRIIHPLPTPPKRDHKPEWAISDEDYENIISVIRHQCRTFETTPSTYAIHDEEDLRNMILANLNSYYKGGASGETFRKSGKTDIRLEMENRAAFIAECKVWRGPKELLSALDQLLGYFNMARL